MKLNGRFLGQLYRDAAGIEQDQSLFDYFRSFVFQDNVTNETAIISNEPDPLLRPDKNYLKPNPPSQHNRYRKNNLNFLKSTRQFQLSCLQKKNYKLSRKFGRKNNAAKDHSASVASIQEKSKQKREQFVLRKRRQKLEYQREKQQLSRLLQLNDHGKHISISKKLSPSLAKNGVEQYRRKTHKVEFKRNDGNQSNSGNKIKIFKKGKRLSFIDEHYEAQMPDVREANDTEEMITRAGMQIRQEVRKNGEYLITPNPLKLMLSKLNRSKQTQHSKKITTQKVRQSTQNKQNVQLLNLRRELEPYFFSNNESEKILTKLKASTISPRAAKETRKNTAEGELLLQAIADGNYFKIQIQLSLNPSLMEVRDSRQNNLLHLCILNNNQQLFEMILKKSKKAGINLLSQKNKSQKTPEDLGNIFSFFKKPSLIQEIKKQNREMSLACFGSIMMKIGMFHKQ